MTGIYKGRKDMEDKEVKVTETQAEEVKTEDRKTEEKKMEKTAAGKSMHPAIVIALIAAVCLIVCSVILVSGVASYKSRSNSGGISATGSASCDFDSDLIVWRGYFSSFGETSEGAYRSIKRDSDAVKDYLKENGVKEDEIVFSPINISKHYTETYNDEGNYIGDVFDGYDLYQDVCITSNDVDKIEEVSRDISGLIETGIEFSSDSPEYYYTKLDELKLQLIEDASANAKQRIDIMAAQTGDRAGKLSSASLGVFQITATNSDEDEYSYGGTFNTYSRSKTASITVKLNYDVR